MYRDIGIDLGTSNTLVYVKNKGIIIREPSVVAVNTYTERASYVGQDAKDVIGRTPGSIVAVKPIEHGVIADFDIAAVMLREFISRALKGSLFTKARVWISIPSEITPVERKAVRESTEYAGAKKVTLIEQPMAASIGAGLPITEAMGNMIVDIGGGTTEVALVSMGSVVVSKSIRVGGDEMDNAIISFIKRKYNLLIGERTAEELKKAIGSAYPLDREEEAEISGRNSINGLPENITVTSAEIRDALSEPLSKVIEAIKNTLEKVPPELSADIIEEGIRITGGGAVLRGIDSLINRETGIPVFRAEYPMDCVVKGIGKVMENPNKYRYAVSEEPRYI